MLRLIIVKDASTATNEMPLIVNNHAVPNGPTNAAANAGPKIREPVITAVFNAIALLMSSGGASSTTNPRRAGLSKAFAKPSSNASTYTTGTVTKPAKSKIPNNKACAVINDCVSKHIRRLSRRSATAPAHAPKMSIGKNCMATVIPRSVALPVRRYTKIDIAVDCNHDPTLENSKPPKNKRALRFCNERKVCEEPIGFSRPVLRPK